MSPLRLVGTWNLDREVVHADGARYTVSGRATLRREDDDRVRWDERGTMRWEAGSAPVSRTQFLVRAPGAASWRVVFEDGRDFHPWTPGRVEHACGRDLYRGDVDVPDGPTTSWELTWHVTGPEKDYDMHTRYTLPR